MNIAVLDDYQGVSQDMADWANIPSHPNIEVFRRPLIGHAEIIEKLSKYEIIAAMRERTPFSRETLQQLPNLRLLVTTGMRNGAIDLTAATEFGITVSGTHGSGIDTAELTWGLIFSLLRNIPREDAAVRAGIWQTSIGTGLYGKTLGVLGLGRLGTPVAVIGKAFGMKVIAWSQNLTETKAREVGVNLVSKNDLFIQSDILTVHVVLSERTRGLIGLNELQLMKPSSYLINTSRGPIVDETALIDSLSLGTIRGAGIDVYGQEPLPLNHPLTKLNNTVLTPHLGYVTDEAYRVFYQETIEDIVAFINGTPIRILEI